MRAKRCTIYVNRCWNAGIGALKSGRSWKTSKGSSQGGKLLAKGRDTQAQALDYARLEQSEAGENYFYVPVRAIKPQEGGLGSEN